MPLISTLALSSEALRSQDQIHDLLEVAGNWECEGFYIVCEHSNGEYLVSDPNWIANVLDLCAGLRLRKSFVVLGYCTHQFIIASLARVSGIASGTWMNVRSFPPEKFNEAYDDEIRQRAIWYYCPQSSSEYKLTFLDLAHSQALLQQMAPDPALGSSYASGLFGGAQPTTVGLSEQNAFRHYLQCLHSQVRASSAPSFDAALTREEQNLERMRVLLTQLRQAGVTGQLRDFFSIIDCNLAAIRALSNTRGYQLRRQWNQP